MTVCGNIMHVLPTPPSTQLADARQCGQVSLMKELVILCDSPTATEVAIRDIVKRLLTGFSGLRAGMTAK
jgi:hypothetical protein